jgi:transcriptional/translational regulatory protein YebC/TACO1
VRSIFTKFGGNLGETGAVSFMFDKLGSIEFDAARQLPIRCSRQRSRPAPTTSESDLDGHYVYCHPDRVCITCQGARGALRRAPRRADLLAAEKHRAGRRGVGQKLVRMIEGLEDSDDVQNIYANFEIADEVLERLSA